MTWSTSGRVKLLSAAFVAIITLTSPSPGGSNAAICSSNGTSPWIGRHMKVLPLTIRFSTSSIIASMSDIPGTNIKTEDPCVPTDAVICEAISYSLPMFAAEGGELHFCFSHSLNISRAFFAALAERDKRELKSSTKNSFIGNRRAPT